MIVPEFDKLRGANASEKSICKNYPEFYEYLEKNYPKGLGFSEKIYWYRHNINTYPVCLNCGNRVKYAGPARGYYQYCSLKCSNGDPMVKERKNLTSINKYGSVEEAYNVRMQKTKKTLIEKHGSVEEAYNVRMQKVRETNLERYGVEYSTQSDEVKGKIESSLIEKYGSVEEAYNLRMQKVRETNLERYGVEYSLMNDEIKEKSKTTCLSKYGETNASKSKEIKKKIKHTNLERYGVEYSFQSEDIKDRIRNTNLEKYGVEYPMQNQSILSKSLQTRKKKILTGHTDIIGVEFEDFQTVYTCTCPDPNCNKCASKTYKCNSVCYYNRRYHGLEVCTNLLPVQKSQSKGTSLEIFVTKLLDEYGIEYITNTTEIIPPKELDIYIPSKKLAIECNGCFWHSSFNKSNNYHIDKYNECETKGIQLLTLWEDQIIKFPELVKSIVLSKLGIFERKIYARSCSIRELSTKEAVEFLKDNHLQGNANSSIKLGLYHNDELVSVMTFGGHRRLMNNNPEKETYELYRFCNKLNTTVIGGASKLLKHFIKTYHPKQIISFASKDISNGGIYRRLGFEKIHESQSYWFIDSKTMQRYHRYKFRKSELDKMSYANELDFLRGEKYLKIFDTGQLKFSMTIK